MIDVEPGPQLSSETPKALTVALLKPVRDSRLYHSKNSSSAMLYTRRVIGEETLSNTSPLSFCHSAVLFTTTGRSFRSSQWTLREAIERVPLCGECIKCLVGGNHLWHFRTTVARTWIALRYIKTSWKPAPI